MVEWRLVGTWGRSKDKDNGDKMMKKRKEKLKKEKNSEKIPKKNPA